MPDLFPNNERSRRGVVRALALNTELVTVVDNDPDDEDPDPEKVKAKPAGLAKRSLSDVALKKKDQIEIFRGDLKKQMPGIKSELDSVKLSSSTVIGLLRDFCTAAFDVKG